MFGFFKKKKEATREVPVLSMEECARLQQDIEQLNQEITNCTKSERQAELYEQVGLKYAELNESEMAISSLEESLTYKESIGEGYKRLLSLYNEKRGEAARNGDDEGIDYYMGKMDELRQLAKKVTLQGNN